MRFQGADSHTSDHHRKARGSVESVEEVQSDEWLAKVGQRHEQYQGRFRYHGWLRISKMGMEADFFVGGEVAAQEYSGRWAGPPEDYWQTKGISALELSKLWAIVAGKSWDMSLYNSFPVIKETDDAEQAVFSLPDELVAILSGMDGQTIEQTAVRWAKTEELARSGVVIIRAALERIVHLAKRAQEHGQHVYLWNSV